MGMKGEGGRSLLLEGGRACKGFFLGGGNFNKESR